MRAQTAPARTRELVDVDLDYEELDALNNQTAPARSHGNVPLKLCFRACCLYMIHRKLTMINDRRFDAFAWIEKALYVPLIRVAYMCLIQAPLTPAK